MRCSLLLSSCTLSLLFHMAAVCRPLSTGYRYHAGRNCDCDKKATNRAKILSQRSNACSDDFDLMPPFPRLSPTLHYDSPHLSTLRLIIQYKHYYRPSN